MSNNTVSPTRNISATNQEQISSPIEPMNSTTTVIASAKQPVASGAYLSSIFYQSPAYMIMIVFGTVAVASIIVVPLSIILTSG